MVVRFDMLRKPKYPGKIGGGVGAMAMGCQLKQIANDISDRTLLFEITCCVLFIPIYNKITYHLSYCFSFTSSSLSDCNREIHKQLLI